MAEPSLFPVTPQSSPQRRLPALAPAGQTDVGEGDSQDLRRRQSVRFMGPCSVQPRGRRVDASRNSGDTDRGSADTHEVENMGQMHSREDSSDQRLSPPHRAPPPIPLPGIAASCLEALAAGDEYYTPEDDIASAPSSFRRLHRSRSMLTGSLGARPTQDNSAQFVTSGFLRSRPMPATTSRRFFRSDPNNGRSSHQTPTLRAPKSLSFLSSRRSQSKSSASQHLRERDTTPSGLPNLPEDGSSAAEKETPRPKYKSSTLFGSLNSQSDLKIRKSLRGSSSTQSSQQPGSAPQQDKQELGTLRSKARNASRSLRIKLRNLFTVARPDEDLSIPCQHIEAQRSHGTPLQHAFSIDDEAHNKEHFGLVRSPPRKVATLETASTGLVHSRQASFESLRSERDRNISSGSSLTSWAHSGPSTLTSQEQQQWREWEKQRLSVIREHGAHAPSPSMRRRALGSGVFKVPDSVGEDAGVLRPIVDSQRIYSALVKRMNAMNTQSSEDAERQSETPGPGNSVRPPGRSSSRTPDTIRHVSPGRKVSKASEYTTTPTRSSGRASVSRRRDSSDSQTYHLVATPSARSGYYGGMSSFSSRERSTPVATARAHDNKAADNGDGFNQEDTLADWRPRLAGTPASHLFRTGSPFRRALRRSMQEEQDAWAEQRFATRQDHSLRSEYLPEIDSDSARDAEYSESVYSSDESDSGPEKATGQSKQSSRVNTLALHRPGGCREASTASSVEWKTWLSAKIDKFEPPQSSSKSSNVTAARPPQPRISSTRRFPSLRGHVREHAQIHDDEHDHSHDSDDDDVFEPSTITTTRSIHIRNQPTLQAPLARVEPNVPSPLRVDSVNKRHPSSAAAAAAAEGPANNNKNSNNLLLENESPTTRPPPPRPPPPPAPQTNRPPIPPRSKMRPDPLRIMRPPSLKAAGSSTGPGRLKSLVPPPHHGGGGGGVVSVGTSPSVSVVSSPGLSEALQRQFGGLITSSSGGYGCGSGSSRRRLFIGDCMPGLGGGGGSGDGEGVGGSLNWRVGGGGVGVGNIAEVLERERGQGNGDGDGYRDRDCDGGERCDESVAFI